MRSLIALGLCCLAFPAVGEDLKYTIYFNGIKAGEETFQSDGGNATGDCTMNLGGATIKEKVSVQFDGGKLVSSETDLETPGSKGHLQYSGGKFTMSSAKGTKTVPYAAKPDLYAGNFMVPLWSGVAKVALKELADHPSATLNTLLIDVGQEIPVIFRAMPPRQTTIGGQVQAVKALQINLTSIQAELDVDAKGRVIAFDVPGQKLRFVLDGWEGLFVDPLSKYPELSQPTFKTTIDDAVAMQTRDGVKLVATVIRPTTPGRYPVILERTPYGRNTAAIDGAFYAQRGYVLVSQDVRGRGDSAGEWDPFVHEGPDGFDCIQWAAKQPWSDGNVGMIGGSYGGYVQWAAAVLKPPALKCIVPQVSPPDAMRNIPYEFGVPFLYADLWWAKIVAGSKLDLSSFGSPLPHAEKFATLPLKDADQAVLGQKVPFLSKWLNRTTSKDWKGFDFYEHLKDANVPAFQISGWYDGDGIGTKLIWAEERRLGRKDQWLIEGPWSHAFNSTSSLGMMDFGPSAIIDLDSLYVRWFDTWLKGKKVSQELVPRAKVFVTGANKWVNLADWPDSTEKRKKLYLSAGELGEAVPVSQEDSYTYDPLKNTDVGGIDKDVSPSKVTGEEAMPKKQNGGFMVYRSKAFADPVTIAGPAMVNLYFKTNARNTDFFASIVDVDEKNHIHAIGQAGKIRASYLNGVDKVVPLTPGKVYQAHIQPWEFAHEFKKGHRLGLIICSTLFPFYARNLGTTAPIATGTRTVVQHNHLLFGKGHPSSIEFEIMTEK